MAIPKSTAPAKLVPAGSDEAAELDKVLAPCGLWSVPPTMMTMHLDNPEVYRAFPVTAFTGAPALTLQRVGMAALCHHKGQSRNHAGDCAGIYLLISSMRCKSQL